MPKIPDIAIEATSTIAGAGAAYQAGDPSAGLAVSEFLNNGLRGLLNHFSSQRQSKRITDVTEFALNEIRRRLENGENLRDDGFFDKTIDRSDAEEVFEAVLLKIRDEPEENKIPYMGSLFANACFDHGLDSGLLHFLCKEFESLTYRQLCIIKMVNERKYRLREKSIQEDPQFKTGQNTYTIPSDEHPILTELATLCNREYIIGRVSDAPLTTTDTIYLLKLDTIGPAGPGVLMYKYMKLESIPETDVKLIVEALS